MGKKGKGLVYIYGMSVISSFSWSSWTCSSHTRRWSWNKSGTMWLESAKYKCFTIKQSKSMSFEVENSPPTEVTGNSNQPEKVTSTRWYVQLNFWLCWSTCCAQNLWFYKKHTKF